MPARRPKAAAPPSRRELGQSPRCDTCDFSWSPCPSLPTATFSPQKLGCPSTIHAADDCGADPLPARSPPPEFLAPAHGHPDALQNDADLPPCPHIAPWPTLLLPSARSVDELAARHSLWPRCSRHNPAHFLHASLAPNPPAPD